MEHMIISSQVDVWTDPHRKETVLYCVACQDWISTEEDPDVINAFKSAPCEGTCIDRATPEQLVEYEDAMKKGGMIEETVG